MKKELLDILACPVCKGAVKWQKEEAELVCRFDKLAFPIKDGIPVMIPSEARQLSSDELERIQ